MLVSLLLLVSQLSTVAAVSRLASSALQRNISAEFNRRELVARAGLDSSGVVSLNNAEGVCTKDEQICQDLEYVDECLHCNR